MRHDCYSLNQSLPQEDRKVALESGVWAHPLKNENGAVLVISIMILAVLTFLGIAALDTTTTELRISTNDKVYKQAFYRADTGISYAVQRGIIMFPMASVGSLIALNPAPVDLPAGIALQYTDNGGSPRRVEVRSIGTAPRGANATIVAGIYGVMVGAQGGMGNATNY